VGFFEGGLGGGLKPSILRPKDMRVRLLSFAGPDVPRGSPTRWLMAAGGQICRSLAFRDLSGQHVRRRRRQKSQSARAVLVLSLDDACGRHPRALPAETSG